MRRHRAAAPFLAAALVFGVAEGAAAADPPDRGPWDRIDLIVGAESSAKVGPAMSTQAVPGANGRIAFVQTPPLTYPDTIWTMTASGTDKQSVVTDVVGVGAAAPEYSPGGKFIAYSADVGVGPGTFDREIFVVAADGSSPPKRLTNSKGIDDWPSWTPDGARILFASDRRGNFDLFSIRVDGTGLFSLTHSYDHEVMPVMDPWGVRIAFSSDRGPGENFEIWAGDPGNLGNAQRRTLSLGDNFNPTWSPTGDLIAFDSDRTGNLEIWVVGRQGGTDDTNLTKDSTHHDLEPSWSPDGTTIAFWAISDGDADLYLMPAHGGAQAPVGVTSDHESGPSWQPIPEFPLVDARFSTFESDIEWVYAEGITVGCSPERYCPDDPVTREQMAIFLDRALDLPATPTDYFTDDTGRTGEAAINRLRAAGITAGCTPTTYCPTANVTRAQMASFLVRAFDLPPTSTDYFTDDASSTHQQDINALRAAGITSGCTPTTYCPTASVTRGQMAAFLRRALD